jgi:hypothetical protein
MSDSRKVLNYGDRSHNRFAIHIKYIMVSLTEPQQQQFIFLVLLFHYFFTQESKFPPITCHECTEWKYTYSSTLSLNSLLDGAGCLTIRPLRLNSGSERYPLYGRMGESQGRSGRVQKTFLLSGFDPPTAQAVANRYTDCAIPART